MSLIYQGKDMVNGRRPGLYLGGKGEAKNREKLEQWKVTHILNMTPTKEVGIEAGVPNYFESSSKFVYRRIPLYDTPTSAPEFKEAADEICAFIAKGLLHGSVLVHCQKGVSRSTTAVLMYLMRRAGMSLEEAQKLVQRRRPQAVPIPAFVEMLKEYEQICQSLGVISEKKNVAAARVIVAGPPSKRPRRGNVGPQLPTQVASADTSSEPEASSEQESLSTTKRKAQKSKGTDETRDLLR